MLVAAGEAVAAALDGNLEAVFGLPQGLLGAAEAARVPAAVAGRGLFPLLGNALLVVFRSADVLGFHPLVALGFGALGFLDFPRRLSHHPDQLLILVGRHPPRHALSPAIAARAPYPAHDPGR